MRQSVVSIFASASPRWPTTTTTTSTQHRGDNREFGIAVLPSAAAAASRASSHLWAAMKSIMFRPRRRRCRGRRAAVVAALGHYAGLRASCVYSLQALCSTLIDIQCQRSRERLRGSRVRSFTAAVAELRGGDRMTLLQRACRACACIVRDIIELTRAGWNQ